MSFYKSNKAIKSDLLTLQSIVGLNSFFADFWHKKKEKKKRFLKFFLDKTTNIRQETTEEIRHYLLYFYATK